MWLEKMTAICRAFKTDERGATAIEYALLAALVGIAIIASTGTMGNHISDDFNEIGNTIERQDINTGHVD